MSWSRSEKIAIASLCLSVVGVAAALAVVPEVRRAGRLSDVVATPAITSFTDSLPASTEPVTSVDSADGIGTDTDPSSAGDSLLAVGDVPRPIPVPAAAHFDAETPRATASSGSSTASEDRVPERDAASPAGLLVRVVHGYRFELNACEGVSRLVTCRATITNLQGDRRLTIGGFSYLSTRAEAIRSVAYTADGSDHFAVEASLGSRAERGAVSSVMAENQPMAATVVFNNIPASTSEFTNMRIAFGSDRREFLVPFASVPIR